MIISRYANSLWNILFPPSCAQCGAEGNYLCKDCAAMIEIMEYQYCPFCYPPRVVQDGRTCERCRKNTALEGLFCAAGYENKLMKRLIHLWKYEPRLARRLTDVFAQFIITHFQLCNKEKLSTDPEALWIPVPLSQRRLRWRGFNQAAELAKELTGALGGEIAEEILIKTRQTSSQTDLSRKERKKNVLGAFSCPRPEIVEGKKILLVDDVFTTGATMEECARVLKKAGAKKIWGVVVARG